MLREKLIQAIEEMKPSLEVPIESRAWRAYKILHVRYIQQMNQEQAAYQVGVGVRHLRREQNMAIQTLADTLYKKVNGEKSGDMPLVDDQVDGNIREDFAWLQQDTQDETTHLDELVNINRQLVDPLVNQRGILLENLIPKHLPPVLVLTAAMRQALISMTTYAINRISSGKITFSAALENRQVEFFLTAESQENLLPEIPNAQESLHTIRLILGKHSANLNIWEKGTSCGFRLRLPAQRFINVLMIDDNKDVADLFKRYTYGTEFFIEHLSDPAQIFQAIDKVQPRIILLDIMIPQVDGWELLGRIRQHPRTQSIPIIVCSVLLERELALALGATAYLSKPATRTDLLSFLEQVMDENPPTPR
jgi:CheY-like chemotaxis protein